MWLFTSEIRLLYHKFICHVYKVRFFFLLRIASYILTSVSYFLAILTFFPDLLFCVYISQFWETEKINSEIKRCNYLKDLHKPWYSHIYLFKDKCELLFFSRKWNNCSSYTPICVWYRIPLLKFPPRTAPDDNSSTFPALLPFAIISMSPGVSLKSSWHLRALILLLWLFHTHTWVTDILWLPIGWTVAQLPPHYHRYLKRMMPPAQPRGATWSCRTVTLCHSTGRPQLHTDIYTRWKSNLWSWGVYL